MEQYCKNSLGGKKKKRQNPPKQKTTVKPHGAAFYKVLHTHKMESFIMPEVHTKVLYKQPPLQYTPFQLLSFLIINACNSTHNLLVFVVILLHTSLSGWSTTFHRHNLYTCALWYRYQGDENAQVIQIYKSMY